MKYFAFAAIASLAAAAPTMKRDDSPPPPFTMIATRSTSKIHLQAITLSEGGLWIGKNTTSYCPSEVVEDCPAPPNPDYPPASIFGAAQGPTGLSLHVEVPGGQRVYVDPQGYVNFTTAHSVGPQNANYTGFNYTEQAQEYSVGQLSVNAYGADTFFACPTVPDTYPSNDTPWRVFANTPGFVSEVTPTKNISDCLGFFAVTSNQPTDRIDAWQYA